MIEVCLTFLKLSLESNKSDNPEEPIIDFSWIFMQNRDILKCHDRFRKSILFEGTEKFSSMMVDKQFADDQNVAMYGNNLTSAKRLFYKDLLRNLNPDQNGK